jgi:hypothetical protein
MAPKKPTVQTRLQQKADKSNKILTGPKGSKPQSTTNARLMKQGDKTKIGSQNVTVKPSFPVRSGPEGTMKRTRFQNPSRGGSTTKSQTVGSAKTGPKTYQVSDPWAGPKRASIGNVKGPASNPRRPTGPVRASIGNVKGPATSPKAPSVAKGAAKGASVLSKAGRLAGRAGAVLTGAELFKQGQSGSELDQLTRAIGGKGSNPNTDIGKRAGDAIKAA